MSTVTKRVTTITLTGETKKVVFDREYPYFEVANMGSAPVYLSKYEDISAGTDGVYTVSAGSSIVARMDSDTVYVSGSGAVQIAAKYEAEHSFKSASKGGDTPSADAYTKAETDMLLSGKFNTEKVVDALPENPETHTLYVLGDETYIYIPVEEMEHDWAVNTPIQREGVIKLVGNGGYITVTKDGNSVTFAAFNDDGSPYFRPRTLDYNAVNDTLFYNNNYLYYGNSEAFGFDINWRPLKWVEKLSGGWFKIGAEAINENLLTNPDFRINQRGLTTYAGKTGSTVYTVDRWCQYASTSSTSISANGVTVNGFFAQYFENNLEVGSEYTLSGYADGNYFEKTFTAAEVTTNIWDVNNDTIAYNLKGHLYANVLYLKVPNYKLSNLKLERGSKATAFVPPEPAAELLKCQRFFFTNNDRVVSSRNTMCGMAVNAGYIVIGMRFPTEMHTSPHVEVNFLAIWSYSTTDLSGDVLSVSSTRSGISFIHVDNTAVANNVYYYKLTADAEIY